MVPSCDFCETQTGTVEWLRLRPSVDGAVACSTCTEALGRAAASRARTWAERVEVDARAQSEGGEVWEADGVQAWYPDGVATTPTRARLRGVEQSTRPLLSR